MQPSIHVNAVAIVASVVVAFVWGFLWYGPFFGKAWAGELGKSLDEKPTSEQMRKSMGLMILGSLLTAYVLTHTISVWMPSAWIPGAADGERFMYSFCAGVFSWLGFQVPMLLGTVSWYGASWKLFAINAAYQFTMLQLMGAVLVFWPW